MEKKNIFLVVLMLLSVVFFYQACTNKTTIYGEPITLTQVTGIADILKSPDSFVDKTVLVTGEIISECPAGGWFMLTGGTAAIFVNLHPSNFAIPQAVGSVVVTQGVVKKNGPKAEIVGKGVKFK